MMTWIDGMVRIILFSKRETAWAVVVIWKGSWLGFVLFLSLQNDPKREAIR